MIVVYTAIFGGSDSLKRSPDGADRCVCYTDDEALTGNGWEIVQHKLADPSRGRSAARCLKVTPDWLFPDAAASVWVDGSIEIRDLPRLIHDAAHARIACLPHPDRSCCYDEGREVIRLERAHPSKVGEALALYQREGFAPTRLSTTGLLYRRHAPRVAAFNAMWRDHLDRFGINDQVHVDYCAWKCGIEITDLRGHYRDNPYAVYDRADHHKRRKPQFNVGNRCEDHYLA